jgi:hypothetical protein
MTLVVAAQSGCLAGAIAGVAHKDEVTLWKPADEAGE